MVDCTAGTAICTRLAAQDRHGPKGSAAPARSVALALSPFAPRRGWVGRISIRAHLTAPASATLAVEVSVSSLRRDLNRKATLYAQAGVEQHWVFDVGGRRVVVHRSPRNGSYTDVVALQAGDRITGAPAGLGELAVDELLRATGS